ncbi:hypothetical protein RJ640_011443 [Escallonia rubra]|uniref:NAB domain-containing protein n=1 Tax=Escallonia rubra TaxID=112253 RepID=A0AA88RY96_9ASTE|nr:hypothetical protein RJ640_011443 [Escallonia rubra]
MATFSHSESRRLYSWWWDSHNSPKNSKWLQENLTDMDAKVKTMIKLIEEDADSFARRAEMYYKKRPELMRLVEEFYRAYRALAERYDHATGELRHAHRTMAAAFPNQEPFVLTEDLSSECSSHGTGPHTPEMPHPSRALNPDDLQTGSYSVESDAGISKRGLKQMLVAGEPRNLNTDKSLNEEVSQLSDENQNLKAKVISESERAGKAEGQIQNLKSTLVDMQTEKEAVLLRYQRSLEKLSTLEGELNCSQREARRLNEQASKAQMEVDVLKETFVELEAEKDAGFVKQKEYLERISNLERMISQAQEDAKGLNKQAINAEAEAQYLRDELSRLQSEKEAALLQYNHSLETTSYLERKISIAKEDASLLSERADRAEREVDRLKKALAGMSEEKETVALQYECCLEKITKLEDEISCAEEDVKRLTSEVLIGASKLKTAEGKCVLLEMSNQSLQLEAANLAKKISSKDQELAEKHKELEKLQTFVQDERMRYAQVEASLQTLQNMHFQSQEEQRALTLELQNGLHTFKGLEKCKHDLEEEIRQVKVENHSLNEQNSSLAITMRDLQNEIPNLRKMRERLEEQVTLQMDQSSALQQEIFRLKEEITGLNRSYQALVEQVKLVGLDPESFGSSVKGLQDENLRLRQICEKERDEKEVLLENVKAIEEIHEKNAALQKSLFDVNGELEGSRQTVRALQESCQALHGEKSALGTEKAIILSQLQIVTENMRKLLEKNTTLESSLSSAIVELDDLRVKSKSLESLCQLLDTEKSNLLTERSTLVVQLENVERKLESLEKRFTQFEAKYAGLERENEHTHSEIEELRVSLGVERQERTSFTLWSETQFASLENHIHLLQEESVCSKQNFQEELDKAVIAQFEIFILQKFIQDMEEKNYYLLNEQQKYVEESKLSDKLIAELESENLEQQVEAELLLVEIEELRLGIYQVFRALEIGQSEDKNLNEQISMHDILGNIKNMKCSLLKYKDDQQLLLVENSVLVALLEQMKLEGLDHELERKNLEKTFNLMKEKLVQVIDEKSELLETNRQLRLEVSEGDQHADLLEAEVESLYVKQDDLQKAYLELQKKYSQLLEENRSFLKKFSNLKEEKHVVEEENNVLALETLALGNLSTIFKSFGTEKAEELKLLCEDLNNVHAVHHNLENEVIMLREKFNIKERENLVLKDSLERLEMELSGVKTSSDRLKQEISSLKDSLSQRELEITDVEQKLKTSHNSNSKLCTTLKGLKSECEESEVIQERLERNIVKLSEDNTNQKDEIKCLREVNRKLDSEVIMLHEEIEERRIREENLSSELQERSNEFELWESEATTFYFDLQISSIHEVLFEDKVHELQGVCESLEDENASKTQEIQQMKERVGSLENEIKGFKTQLLAYAPVIGSLRDNIASLERNTLSWTRVTVADYQKTQDAEVEVYSLEKSCQEQTEDQYSLLPTGISDLQELQTRIKAVEKVMVEEINRLERQESLISKIKVEAAMREIGELKLKCNSIREHDKQKGGRGSRRYELSDDLSSPKRRRKISEVRNGILMKDIPLDQGSDGCEHAISRRGSARARDETLGLWEAAEEDRNIGQTVKKLPKQAYEPQEVDIVYHQVEMELGFDKLKVPANINVHTHGVNKGKILERLASDAQKLASLQETVQDLSRKLERNKKSKMAKNVDFETLKEQLQEAQETYVQLAYLNGQLIKNIEDSPSRSDRKVSKELEEAVSVQRKRVSEQARKESEKIGRLLLEIQKIQYVLLKLEEEKQSKGKSGFLRTRSRTSIILKDFIYSGRRNSVKRKKGGLCGCFKPSKNGGSNQITMS